MISGKIAKREQDDNRRQHHDAAGVAINPLVAAFAPGGLGEYSVSSSHSLDSFQVVSLPEGVVGIV